MGDTECLCGTSMNREYNWNTKQATLKCSDCGTKITLGITDLRHRLSDTISEDDDEAVVA